MTFSKARSLKSGRNVTVLHGTRLCMAKCQAGEVLSDGDTGAVTFILSFRTTGSSPAVKL